MPSNTSTTNANNEGQPAKRRGDPHVTMAPPQPVSDPAGDYRAELPKNNDPGTLGLNDLQLGILRNIETAILSGSCSTLVLGAGFSYQATGGLDWKSLTQPWRQQLEELSSLPQGWDDLHPSQMAQVYENTFGRDALEEHVIRATKLRPGFPSDLEKSILSLPIREIFTTNYDGLIEKTLDEIGRPYVAVYNQAQLEHARTDGSSRVIVYKIHGDRSSRGMVITSNDFETYSTDYARMDMRFKDALTSGQPLFYGVSLNDQHLRDAISYANQEGDLHRGFLLISNPDFGLQTFASEQRIGLIALGSIAEMTSLMGGMSTRCREAKNNRLMLPQLLLRANQGDQAAQALYDGLFGSLQDIVIHVGDQLSSSNQTQLSSNDAVGLASLVHSAIEQGFPVPANIMLSLGRYLLQQREFDLARRSLEYARLKLEPKTTEEVDCRRLLGRVYVHRRENLEAIRTLREVICPSDQEPFVGPDASDNLYLTRLYTGACLRIAKEMQRENRRGAAGLFLLERLASIGPAVSSLLQLIVAEEPDQHNLTEACGRLRDCFALINQSLDDTEADLKRASEYAALAYNRRATQPNTPIEVKPPQFETPTLCIDHGQALPEQESDFRSRIMAIALAERLHRPS